MAEDKIKELRALGLEEEGLRADLVNMEIKEKGSQEEAFKTGLQDVRFIEKTLNSLRVDVDSEISFLKKQVSQLINEKVKLQQHVLSLASRINNTELDVCEKTAHS